MTNVHSQLSAEQEQQLLTSYRTLTELAGSCRIPSVLAAVRSSLAELRAALAGQDIEFDYYGHPGYGVPAADRVPQALAA
jgi:hypothetical protein